MELYASVRNQATGRKSALPCQTLRSVMNNKKRKHGSGTEPIRKISKTGKYTYYVTIPKEMLDRLGWRERQKVIVKKSGQKPIIRDWQP